MFRSLGGRPRRGLGVLVLAVATACDDSGTPSAPTPVVTAPTPPSGVTNISGNWSNGQFVFQQGGVPTSAPIAVTITQNDRAVNGTVRFTSPAWSSWRATFSGALAGTSQESQFIGTFSVQSESATSGTCTGEAVFSGRSTPGAMHWEALSLNMVQSGSGQASPGCRGQMLTVAWSLLR